MSQWEESHENSSEIGLPTLPRVEPNPCDIAHGPRAIQSFQDGEVIITQTPEELLRLDHRP